MIDGLNVIAQKGFAALLLWSWQTLALLTCVWVVLKLVRFKSPAQRHQIWLLSLIAVAALPLASFVTRSLPEIRPSNSAFNFAIETPTRVVKRVAGPGKVQTSAASSSPAPPDLVRKLIPSVLFAFWFLGMLIVLTRLLANQISLGQMCRRARPIAPGELDLNYYRAARLRISEEIDSPMLCGCFRPTIILPADMFDWTSPSERHAMIQHELAHVARRDPLANLFQISLTLIFYFHPLFRHACKQLSLERELACDQQVLAGGTCAETYAAGLLKAAERGLITNVSPQLAFFSSPKTLERRIEMIFRERMQTHTWKFVALSAVTIAAAAWLLIPAGPSALGQSETAAQSRAKIKIVKALGERKAYDELIDMALHNSDPEMRSLAVVRLTELEGDGSTDAMFELYKKTDDAQVKIILVDALARISEIEPLVKIALSAQDPEEKQRALRRIKFLKQHSESSDIRNFDVSSLAGELNQVNEEPPPPPPPPPVRREPRQIPPPPTKPN
jgi:beta-lactamase regulating signal transducer with metallopeptidase domain